MTAAKRAARHRRALWVSTALAAVLCAGVLPGPARAQSVTGTGNVYGSSTAMPSPPLSTWSIPTEALYVGLTSPGTLTIAGGGSVADKSAIVGNVSTGTVTVTGTGSTWHSSSVINIGYGAVPAYPGTGTLTIEDGGYVYSGVPGSSNTNTAVSGIVGTFYAGVGTVTVSGTDAAGHASTWENAGQLMVGRYGKGTLTIEGGGFVSNTDGYIGVFADSTGAGNGTVTVSGSDGDGHASTWANSGDLIVGVSGTGTLNVEGGGAVSNGDGYIGYYNTGNTGTVTVTGTDGDGNASTWTNSGDLYVGVYGTGTLNIEAGGTVSNADGVIGYGNTGTATVTGTDGDGHASTWTSSGDLYVGYYGTGTLTVADGGVVGASALHIAEEDGSVGTLNIGAAQGEDAVAAGMLDAATVAFGDGTGTLVFNHTGAVTFAAALTSTGSGAHGLYHYAGDTTLTGDSSGFMGTTTVDGGTLEIAQGGKLGASTGRIGEAAGSDGTVVVTGAGSTWSNSSVIHVGDRGTGTLTIEDGGKVSSGKGGVAGGLTGSGAIGDEAGSNGSVTVTGTGSAWDGTGSLFVGNDGTGTLTIENGGQVSNGNGDIGYGLTGTGTVTVSGAGSTWINTGLYVGGFGKGTLTVEDKATVTSVDSHIGDVIGSKGAVTVTGDGTSWTNTDLLYVGFRGTGALTVSDGGKVSAQKVVLGRAAGSNGTINIGAAQGDAAATAGALDLDTPTVEFGNGAGTLNFNHTGAITFDLALASTGSGTHALNHYAGTTTLTGDSSGFTGTATVEGGTLEIAEGGKLGGAYAYIGRAAGSDGTVVVTGAGTWDTTGILYVGDEGKGTLTVEAGGTVASHRTVIGDAYTGEGGVATVTGPGSTWTTGQIDVGFGITGTLTVADGGKVTSTASDIGFAATGTATVTGAGSTWTSDYLAVGLHGDDGNGTLTVAEGGKVVAPTVLIGLNYGSAGTINIGAAAGEDAVAVGTLDATTLKFANGNGALVFNHTGTLTFAAALTSTGYGTHALDHYAGTTTLTGDSSGFKGTTTVYGGTLLVGDPSGNGKLGGTVHVEAGGTLGGSGTILGATTVDGTLSAGNSPGTLTFASDLTLNADSTSVFELNSPGVVGGTGAAGNDLVVVGGDLTLAGTLGARVAAAGYYRLFNYGGTLSGTFAGGTLTGTGGFTPASPNDPDVQYGIPGQVNLSVLSTGQTMQFWDGPDATGNGVVDGGAGTWSTAGTNWTGKPGEAAVNGTFGGSVGVFAGAAGGTVTVDGTQGFDTLQFSTGGYTLQGGALALGAAAGGTFNVDNGVSATVASAIGDGAGSALRKTGAGTLVLSGANGYTGGTVLLGGVLSVAADTNLGASGGGLSFEGGTLATTASFVSSRAVTLDATGTIDVSAATTLGLSGAIGGSGALVKQGAGTLDLADGNDYSGGTSILAGTLRGSATSFGGGAILDDGALVIDQAADAVFTNVIDGNGTLIKTGAGALTLTGTSTLIGATTVEAGLLAVDGSLAGSVVTAADGSTLGGVGTVGGVVADSGGTVAPGDGGIGTLRVAGDLTMAAGSQLAAEIDGSGASDRVAVSGAADITGAALDVSVLGARIGRYTLVTAGGGLTGTFGTLTGDAGPLSAFVGMTDAYDARNAYLDVSQVRDFADAALTHNQEATAGGIQSLSGGDPFFTGNPLYNAVLGLPDDAAARAAFDALSGEVHASLAGALVEDSVYVRDAATSRIRAAFGAVGASPAPVMAYADPEPGTTAAIAVAPDTDRFALWAQGFGGWGHADADGNAARLTHSTGGFLVGGDAAVFETWRLGLLAGYSRTDFDVKDRASSGTSDNYHLGLYGGTQWGALGFRAGAAYTWHDVTTGRSVALPGFDDSPQASYHAGTAQAFGELGYGFHAGGIGLEPFANLAYVDLDTDGFTERGGAAALHGDGGNTDVTFTTLGLHASGDLDLGGTVAAVRGTLGWRHAFGDTTPLSAFALAGGSPFTVAGVPIARDALVLDAGLDVAITSNATLGLAYGGQFGSHAIEQSIKASLAVRF